MMAFNDKEILAFLSRKLDFKQLWLVLAVEQQTTGLPASSWDLAPFLMNNQRRFLRQANKLSHLPFLQRLANLKRRALT